MADTLDIQSVVPGVTWPGMPADDGALMLATQFQLEQSQWWSPEELRAQQFRQAELLLRHAYQSVPFYRQRLDQAGYAAGAGLDQEAWARIPLLTRRHLHAEGDALKSNAVPAGHGQVTTGTSSGSTGTAVRFARTDVTRFMWYALTLRDHLWHQRDFAGKLAAIRLDGDRRTAPDWGPATAVVGRTGPATLIHASTEIDEQLSWLASEQPDYLLTMPTLLRALIRRGAQTGFRPGKLREVRTINESLRPEVRDLCVERWGCPVTDIYSAREVGYIALQCPASNRYHVQAESLIVEVLDDAGRSCAPGEIGRVVVTTLHNFAMPLIRYVLGDYAQAGGPCPCGRGLPVLQQIMGRERNLLTLPDGRRHFPAFSKVVGIAVAPVIAEYRLIQRTVRQIDVQYVAPRVLTASETTELADALRQALQFPNEIRPQRVDAIDRGPGFKIEDFVSEVPQGD